MGRGRWFPKAYLAPYNVISLPVCSLRYQGPRPLDMCWSVAHTLSLCVASSKQNLSPDLLSIAMAISYGIYTVAAAVMAAAVTLTRFQAERFHCLSAATYNEPIYVGERFSDSLDVHKKDLPPSLRRYFSLSAAAGYHINMEACGWCCKKMIMPIHIRF